jgi:hypothetical protein
MRPLAEDKGSRQAGLRLAGLHLRFGWWSFFVFAAFGLTLETLHGLKIRTYLDVSNETRRLLWTLAHAHGTLLGLVHVVLGLSLRSQPGLAGRRQALVSRSFIAASILLPGGFLLGGVRIYAGDPGLGVVLVPIGAVCLLLGAALVASDVGALDSPDLHAPRPPRKA